MTDEQDDLELQALQRRLDDAFATTRPRRGFEDDLWLRMQARRPLWARIRDAFGGLAAGVREAPAVPLAAVAVVLIAVVGIGIVGTGLGSHNSESATSGLGLGSKANQPATADLGRGPFGSLPAPSSNPVGSGIPSQGATTYGPISSAPVRLTWTGQLNLTITSAPVFRYTEPTKQDANRFAATLGASPQAQVDKSLGTYAGPDYQLQVFGTSRAIGQAPTYLIRPGSSMTAVGTASSAPTDLAMQFLTQRNLVPDWPNQVTVEGTTEASSAQPTILYLRQFVAPGYGSAYLVDSSGRRSGLLLSFNNGTLVQLEAPLPVALDSAQYPIITPDQAVQKALATSSPLASAPTAQLTQASLVYMLAPGLGYGYYEPAYLFSGLFQINGATYVKNVLVPAIP